MDFDLSRARRDTPGTAHVTHFNNAGASLRPTVVTEAVIEHLRLEELYGGYEAAARAKNKIDRTYSAVAELINAAPDEIALVENATQAWDMAFYSMTFRPGDRILTGRGEYNSNVIAMLQVARRTGAVIEVIDNDTTGQFDVAALENRLDSDVALVAATYAPSQDGVLNPVAEIGALTKPAGIPFLLDACQAVGQVDLDVHRIGCDMLSATGRKFLRGPRGTGFLYVAQPWIEKLEPVFLDTNAASWLSPTEYRIRSDARRFENFETSIANQIGLGVAVDYALGWGMPAIQSRIGDLATALRSELSALPGVRVHDQGILRGGIVTFDVAGQPSAEVARRLAAQQINTSVSAASMAQNDLPARGLPDLVRASVHYYNSQEEIEKLRDAIADL